MDQLSATVIMFPSGCSNRLPVTGYRLLSACLLAVGILVAGCSQLAAPTAAPVGDEAPVNLRDLQVATSGGHRAVLLQLTRLPTLVRYSSSSEPARITVQAWGPEGDTDLPERVLPQSDALVRQVTVSRNRGELRVIIELNQQEPPPHRVHEMADWIMVRFTEAES
jgi:hypothetical protein